MEKEYVTKVYRNSSLEGPGESGKWGPGRKGQGVNGGEIYAALSNSHT